MGSAVSISHLRFEPEDEILHQDKSSEGSEKPMHLAELEVAHIL